MSEHEENFDPQHISPIAASLKGRVTKAATLAVAYREGHLTPEGIAEAFAKYEQGERMFRDALYAAMGSRSGRPVPRLATHPLATHPLATHPLATHATPDPVKPASEAPMGPEEAKAVQATVRQDAAAKSAWAKVEVEPELPLAFAPVEAADAAYLALAPASAPASEAHTPEMRFLGVAQLRAESAEAAHVIVGLDESVEDYSPRPYTVPQKKGSAAAKTSLHGHSEVGEGFTRLGRYIGPDTHEIRGAPHVTIQEFARRAPPLLASTVQYLVGRGDIKAVRVKAINGRKLSPPRVYIPVSEVERIIAEGPESYCNIAIRRSQRRPRP